METQSAEIEITTPEKMRNGRRIGELSGCRLGEFPEMPGFERGSINLLHHNAQAMLLRLTTTASGPALRCRVYADFTPLLDGTGVYGYHIDTEGGTFVGNPIRLRRIDEAGQILVPEIVEPGLPGDPEAVLAGPDGGALSDDVEIGMPAFVIGSPLHKDPTLAAMLEGL